MAQKSDLIAAIQFIFDEILAMADALTAEERLALGQVDRWSDRDMLAHLAYSNRQVVEMLAAGQRGETAPTGLSNEEVYALYKDQPWDKVLGDLRQSQQDLLAQVQALSEEALNAQAQWLNNRPVWRVTAGIAILHPLIHLAQALIERGQGEKALQLDQRSQAFIGKLDEGSDWQGMLAYNTGCYHALLGEKAAALSHLEQGFRLSQRMVTTATEDTDLASLYADPDFQTLIRRYSA